MSKKSQEFEQLQSRVFGLIKADATSVEWDKRILDPQTGESRQIDVFVVEADGRNIAVECRIHKKPQDVTWIEELHGRRQSLGVDEIIAVSNSGFTAPAKVKAAHFGISLYDLNVLSDSDIVMWFRKPTVKAKFSMFDHLVMIPIISKESLRRLPINPTLDRNGLEGALHVMSAISRSHTSQHWGKVCHVAVSGDDFTFGGEPVKTIFCEFVFKQISRESNCSLVRLQQTSRAIGGESASISNFTHSVPEIIEFNGKVSLMLSTRDLDIPPCSIFDGVEVFVPGGEKLERHDYISDPIYKFDFSSFRTFVLASDSDLSAQDAFETVARRVLEEANLSEHAASFGIPPTRP